MDLTALNVNLPHSICQAQVDRALTIKEREIAEKLLIKPNCLGSVERNAE